MAREHSPKRKAQSFLSFSLALSPFVRRNSFLSKSMIDDEEALVYEAHSYFSQDKSYNIISLRESQGFIFNQDLFATPVQQLRSIAKRMRSVSFNKKCVEKPRLPAGREFDFELAIDDSMDVDELSDESEDETGLMGYTLHVTDIVVDGKKKYLPQKEEGSKAPLVG